MTGLEILAVYAINQALSGGQSAVLKFMELDPPARLLAILYEGYGDVTGLKRKDFIGWAKDEELEAELLNVLGGNVAFDDAAHLTQLIEMNLDTVPGAKQHELASEMAEVLLYLAPKMQQELGDGVAYLAHKLDTHHAAVMGALSDDRATSESGRAIKAILYGPLGQVHKEGDAKRARELAENGKPLDAAALFMQISEALEDGGLATVAESYKQLAVDLYIRGESPGKASSVLLELAEVQVRRNSGSAEITVSKLRGVLPDENQWIANALEGRIKFAEDPQAAIEALRLAAEKKPNDATHLANLTDLLTYFGQTDEVLKVSIGKANLEEANEPALRIALNRLDAFSDSGDPETSDSEWDNALVAIEKWDEPVLIGLAWQRRGVRLAKEGRVQGCHDAYRRAIEAFSMVPGYEEQAADAVYSMDAASIMNAAPPTQMELRALAYEQRGIPSAPVALAARLVRKGMDNRISGRFPDAIQAYGLALEANRRAGSLQGELEAWEKLGELFQAGSEPTQATGAYINAGKSKEAAASARYASATTLAPLLELNGPRWVRAATLAVIAEVGDRLPREALEKLFPDVLLLASSDDGGFIAPQPGRQAKKTLAAVAEGLNPAQAEEAFAILIELLSSPDIDVRWEAEKALASANQLGLFDATLELIASFLEDPYNSRVPLEFVAESAEKNEEARKLLQDAAIDCSPALAALSMAGQVSSPELIEAAEAAAQRLIETVNVETESGQITIGMGSNIAQQAIAAQNASPQAITKIGVRMLEIAEDAADAEMNRVSAVEAIFNLSAQLSDEDAESVALGLLPLTLGQFELNDLNLNASDPFARFKVSLGSPGMLRSAALQALARVVSTHSDLSRAGLAKAIYQGIVDGSPSILVNAVDALARVPEIESPIPIEILMRHENPQVRVAAIRCWVSRNPESSISEPFEGMESDPDPGVRMTLLSLAIERGKEDLIQRFADQDEHSRIRRVAEKYLAS